MELCKAVLKIQKPGTQLEDNGDVKKLFVLDTQEIAGRIAGESIYVPEKEIKKFGNFYQMKVQYNPSSISFSAGADDTSEGEENYRQRVSMQTELIFDDTAGTDAFASQQEAKREGSVQAQVEALISLGFQTPAPLVSFIWGSTSFAGELESVSAEYQMFNRKGNPIRAKVSVSIRQALAGRNKALNKEIEHYWNDAWERFRNGGI